MRLSLLFFAGLALTKAPKPRKIQHGLRSQSPNTRSLLTLRQSSCDDNEYTCEVDYCMPNDATCCYEGDGSYCESGDLCVDGGCCELGDDCDGSLTAECDDDEEECGMGCMPQGSVCCDDSSLGMYCDAGETCDGILCESGSASSDEDDDDDGPHLCARRRGGGGGGGGGGGDDDCDAAGTTRASLLLAGLVAVIPLVL